jgi:hypothetical protein
MSGGPGLSAALTGARPRFVRDGIPPEVYAFYRGEAERLRRQAFAALFVSGIARLWMRGRA